MPRGKASYAGIEINFSANYSDLVESLQTIDRESKKIEKSLSATQNALKFDPENVELAAVQQKVLADAIAKTEERLKLLKSTEQEIKTEFEKGGIPTEQYAKYLAEIAKTEKALKEFKAAQAESAVSADDLANDLAKAKEQLKEYTKAAEAAAKSGDEAEIFSIDKKIQETSNRIEEYKRKINTLLNSESGLKSEQDKLRASTDNLSEAQRNAASSAAQMGDGFTVTKGVISDLASTVIKKTTNALIDFTKGSLEAASSLYEVENVVDVSFGNMRNKVDEFSDTAIEYYGISELTAKRTASLFAAMGEGMDLALDKATDMAIGLAKRSADMASFYDISQEITSTALKSVFTGETESLKRFGVVMTEANLQQYALAQGIQKTVKEMTQAEKVQLRYNYLMEATASSEGDFARTSDSFANKTRQLKERLTETSVAIGERFIANLDGAFNTLDKLLEKVNEAAENGDLDDFIKDVSDILKNLLNVLTAVGGVLVKFPKLTAATAAGFTALKAANKVKGPVEGAANALNKLAFNMSNATEQTGLFSDKLSMRVGGWTAAATAAVALGMAIADYIDRLDEELKNQKAWNDEQMKAIEAAQELTATYKENAESRRENISNIEAEYGVYREQAQRLTELASKTEKTSADLAEMAAITEQLNSGMQGLGLEFNNTTGEINMQGEELQKLIGSYENLAKAEAAKNALTDIYEEQYKATAKVNANVKKRYELTEKLNEAEVRLHEAERIAQTLHESTDVYDSEEVEKYAKNLEEAKAEVDGLSAQIAVLSTEYQEYAEQLGIANEELEEMNELYEQASEGSKDAADKLAAATEKLQEQAEALDELKKAYSSAQSALSGYASQISDLVSIQKSFAEGTEMSTLEMLDMIKKYPSLIGKIKETENGYILEKQAIEELINVRIRDMKISALQQRKAAENLYLAQNENGKAMLENLKKQIDKGQITDIAKFQAEYYGEGLYDALNAYMYEKGVDKIFADVSERGIKDGAKATEEAEKKTEKQSVKSSKATIAEAEAIITALEHKYKQGIISAETYYSDLDKIANEYYGKQGGYLERYMELEDEAQAGLKKAIEDKAKSYQDLESKIEGVIDAQKELKGIESNKSVLAYDEARGFKLEADQAALANASKNLADAQRQLMLSLAEMSGNSGIYGAFADKLAESTSEALKQILPDLTGAYSDAAAYADEMTATTQNYTFNFGDIKTSGDAQEFKKMLNDFVNAVINETQLI
jgi:chromosome segregation ATPase/molecular chaperone GrpE (heat shock protein)